MSAPAATRRRATSGAATLGSETVSTYDPGSLECQLSTDATPLKTPSGSLSGATVVTMSALIEQFFAQVAGPADGAQRRVQDGHPVAQTLRLIEPVCCQEDGHASLPESVDEVVHFACGHRIEARRRFVQEHDLRVAEHRPRKPDALAQPFRQAPAQVLRSIREVDGAERIAECVDRDCRMPVQAGEELEILGDAETRVQARAPPA